MEQGKQGGPNDHLANERTFLAWIRTAVGMMAFGFVVVKFTLFIKQISLALGKPYSIPTHGYSGIAGIIIVIAGMLIAVFSYKRYLTVKKELETGSYHHTSGLITLLTYFIVLMSIFLIIYLINSIS
ncbi:YidH family protein [Chitinophaga sp. Hz27]|uniref:YidH family protein n=1 Tax=Chitinophaga sp. Hz27 TaxID=3347169 RepID=UPI0035DDE0F0